MKMYKIFKQELYKKLKSQIKGNILINKVKNCLIVKISSFNSEYLSDIYVVDDFELKILLGLTSDELSNRIIQQYKSYIFNKFFN